MMVDQNEELYGAAAPHADYQAGDRVRYLDPEAENGEDTGRILHVTTDEGQLVYYILPDITQFPYSLPASDVIERA